MIVLLREMTKGDLELVMAWRSHPEIYKGYYSQKGSLTWEEHLKFWKSRHNWQAWIVQVNDSITTRDVGLVTVGQLDSWYPDVGIFIGEVTLWGKGIGKEALQLAINWLKEKGYQRARASILKDNLRSQKLFESAGFKQVGVAREGEWLYDITLKRIKKEEI